MTEKAFQAGVEKIARMCGWLVYHTYRSTRSVAGFPDLFMVRGCRAIAAELKSDTGQLSHAQLDWLDALDKTPVEVYVWRPADLDDIAHVLARA